MYRAAYFTPTSCIAGCARTRSIERVSKVDRECVRQGEGVQSCMVLGFDFFFRDGYNCETAHAGTHQVILRHDSPENSPESGLNGCRKRSDQSCLSPDLGERPKVGLGSPGCSLCPQPRGVATSRCRRFDLDLSSTAASRCSESTLHERRGLGRRCHPRIPLSTSHYTCTVWTHTDSSRISWPRS
jgi:hypothetical protein